MSDETENTLNRRERRRRERIGGDVPVSDAKARNAAKARVRAAESRLEAGDAAAALEKLKEAQRLDPESARAWFLTAMIEFNAGRITEAGDAILRAANLDDDDTAIHANCAAIMNLCDRPMEAEASARHAIGIDPDMPEAHCNLGVALEAQGKVTEARDSLSRAIELRPGYSEALISLGNLWFRAGDYISAAETFAGAVRAQPTNVMARTNLGVALRHVGELDAAEQQCLEALQLDRGYAEAHNALGNVRLQLGDLPGAISAFEDAVGIRDTYAEARANLAGALFKSGDLEAAEGAYLDVLERHSEFAEAAMGLGVVLLAMGRLDDANRRFRRAVEIRPALGEAWMNIVDADADGLSDEDRDEIRARAADARLAEEDRIAFLFALGKVEETAGNFEAAAEAYKTANTRRRRQIDATGTPFDADTFDEEIDTVIKTLTDDAVKLIQDFGDHEAEMIFICGMPRSGTTLVEQMLAAHPSVRTAGEVDIVSGLLDAYPDQVPDMAVEEIRALSDTYLARLPVRPADGLRVTDKTPQNVFFLGLITAMFPRAKIVHCVRNADDVALSCLQQNFRAAGLDWTTRLNDIRRYQAAEARVAQHWQAILGDRMLDVAYEDVVADPSAAGRRLLDFLGLEWDDAVTRPHEAKGTVLTASNWQVRKPIYQNAVGRWQSYARYFDADDS